MIRLLTFALGASIFFNDSSFSQSQATLGPCSPAIAGVKGNVSTTCITGDRRIRIARYTNFIDDDRGRSFQRFVSANLGKVVFFDAETDMDSGFYRSSENGASEVGWLSFDDFCPDGSVCGKINVYLNEFNKPSTISPNHGYWKVHGYYLVSGGGFAMGNVEYALRPIDEQEIVMSPKYDTD